jgi:hypothetical protein
MTTDDLINTLVDDLTVRWPLSRAFVAAFIGGTFVAGVLFFLGLGFRPDILHAVETVRFPFKFVVTMTLAITALGLMTRMARPGAPVGFWKWALAGAPLLLSIALLAELLAEPEAVWGTRLVGSNALACLVSIPLLAVGPLACLLAALRYGAPTRPGLAGAVAGLAASGIAATFYASHCPDDSPLFVAVWYSIATAIVVLAGYLAGTRLLKW